MTTNGKPKGGDASNPVSNAVEAAAIASDEAAKDAPAGADRQQGVGQDIQNHLGRKLKASYDELVRQPVPDRFRQLLDELEKREKKP